MVASTHRIFCEGRKFSTLDVGMPGSTCILSTGAINAICPIKFWVQGELVTRVASAKAHDPSATTAHRPSQAYISLVTPIPFFLRTYSIRIYIQKLTESRIFKYAAFFISAGWHLALTCHTENMAPSSEGSRGRLVCLPPSALVKDIRRSSQRVECLSDG